MIKYALAGLLCCIVLAAAEAHAAKPNILFIMVDDLGKDWISCYGADDIQTPNIDALAQGGMKFHNAWSMPQCTPTRVTLLTGQYPWRTGWVNHWDVPRWGVGYFDWEQYITFARVMKTAGYATCAAGKWQINDFRLEPQAMKKHGFDDWCMWTGWESGNPPSGERYWDAYINTPEGSKTYAGKFGPDVYADYLISFMKRHKDEPMCLYFPMALTHGPLVHTPSEPNVTSGKDKLKAMVRYTDHLVGRLMSSINALGIRERTIVIFTTDNGTSGGLRGAIRGIRPSGGKASKFEGGVSEPFIVNCPGLVPEGVETDALTDFSDLLPTFAELGGAELPDVELDGISIAPLLTGKAKDSPRKWIMALGHGAAKLDKKGVHGASPFVSRVIRDRRWKVWVNTKGEIDQLYDMEKGPYEKNNLLSAASDQEAAQLAALARFRQVVASLPKEDARPRYAPRAANSWDRKPNEGAAKAGKRRRQKKGAAS